MGQRNEPDCTMDTKTRQGNEKEITFTRKYDSGRYEVRYFMSLLLTENAVLQEFRSNLGLPI